MCQRKSRCAGGEDLLYSSCQIFSAAIVADLLGVAGADRIMMGSGCCFDTAHKDPVKIANGVKDPVLVPSERGDEQIRFFPR